MDNEMVFSAVPPLFARVNRKSELMEALKTLNLDYTAPVVVVVGGADKSGDHKDTIRQSAEMIGKATEENGAIVISSGTDSGVMAAMGQVRARRNYDFPLVGVVVEILVRGVDPDRNDAAPLEPYHTHFLMVPGREWGDESRWIADLATTLAGEHPSVTVLSNGGKISLKDVTNSLKSKRPVIVLEGTGRLADDLARTLPLFNLIKIVPAQDEPAVFEAISSYLLKKERNL